MKYLSIITSHHKTRFQSMLNRVFIYMCCDLLRCVSLICRFVNLLICDLCLHLRACRQVGVNIRRKTFPATGNCLNKMSRRILNLASWYISPLQTFWTLNKSEEQPVESHHYHLELTSAQCSYIQHDVPASWLYTPPRKKTGCPTPPWEPPSSPVLRKRSKTHWKVN